MVKGPVFIPEEFLNNSNFWFQQMIEKYIGKKPFTFGCSR
jgi:hypothetical protein